MINATETLKVKPGLPQKISFTLWIATVIATPVLISAWGMSAFPGMTSLVVICQLIATVLVVKLSWSGKRIIRAAAVIYAATWLLEYIGSHYGTLFGKYSYTALLMPQAFGVPLLIPMAWAMMLFSAWGVSEYILSPHQTRLGKMYPMVYPVF